MFRTGNKIIFATLLAAIVLPAGVGNSQDSSTRVAWAPSYGGSCEGCDLRGRNMSGWDISNANYPRADLSGALLRATRGIDVDFTHAIAEFTDFRQAVLDGSSFIDAELTEARFDKSSLLNSDFSRAVMLDVKLRGARLNGATLRRANLTDAYAQGADFSGANVSLAIFDNAQLKDALFTNTTMTGASFKRARLDGADFSNVRLMEVDFTGATGLSEANFEGACAGPLSKVPANLNLTACVPLDGTLLVDLK
ncbi:pentapeptide repeat-containing protein [Henriciella sp.]|uniref:pentapeptide repeat-containing protein n=1 Tax=Henriciella sp. TaxID=1968823 RepID=UPI002629D7A4|nr:pentapeptide repeat-containing protein [Henriciella sp.]